MPLKYLLDENLSSAIVVQVKSHNTEIQIDSVQTWRSGEFRSRPDRKLILAAREHGLTLVTYDRRTIPPLLSDLGLRGEYHAGVIFVDERTLRSDDLAGLTRALLSHWDEHGYEEWRNRIGFLKKPTGR